MGGRAVGGDIVAEEGVAAAAVVIDSSSSSPHQPKMLIVDVVVVDQLGRSDWGYSNRPVPVQCWTDARLDRQRRRD